MKIVTVTKENIEQEHICCAITDKKGETQVSSKKAWLKDRFEEGLVFKKLDAKAKVFIEYIPATNAWLPIEAENYMHINCFWVSGQYKGQGYANGLLEECIKDAKQKGMSGLTVISSKKKKPYLSDPSYLLYKGFMIADSASPFFELYYLSFTKDAPIPSFNECAKQGVIEEQGMVLYYTNQCPFIAKYVPLIVEMAKSYGTTISLHKIETTMQAKQAPCAVTTYSFFYNGTFVTNEIFSEKKFEKFLQEHGFKK